MGSRRWTRERVAQGGLLLVLATLVLTAGFLGVVGLVTGSVTGLVDRLPFYVLAMAITFVGGMVILEGELRDPGRILRAAVAVALGAFLVVTFGGEGIAFVLQQPREVLSSQLLFYFLAAGLIGAGLGYWGVRHWNDIAGTGL